MDDEKNPQAIDINSTENGHTAAGDAAPAKYAIKRDLRRRHINMISIAGMIVRLD